MYSLSCCWLMRNVLMFILGNQKSLGLPHDSPFTVSLSFNLAWNSARIVDRLDFLSLRRSCIPGSTRTWETGYHTSPGLGFRPKHVRSHHHDFGSGTTTHSSQSPNPIGHVAMRLDSRGSQIGTIAHVEPPNDHLPNDEDVPLLIRCLSSRCSHSCSLATWK